MDQLADMYDELAPFRSVLARATDNYWLLPKADAAVIVTFIDALVRRLEAAESCLETR